MNLHSQLLVVVFLWLLLQSHFVPLPEALAKEIEKTAAEAEVVRGENYVVYAYHKTELQDYLLGSTTSHHREDHKAYVIVDGQSMFTPEGLLDPHKLDWDKLSSELRKLRVDKQSVAEFHVTDCGPNDSNILTWLLEGFGRNRCGFKHVYWRSSTQRGDFWSRIDLSQDLARSGKAGDEAAIGNELVQVFPVQTFLSRFHSGNADCVVRIIPQLVQQQQIELRGAIRASMQKFVPMVEVTSKKKLLLLVNYHEDARETIDWLREEGSAQLADKLGYEEVTGHFAEYSFLIKNGN
jgi:hypothetical protein